MDAARLILQSFKDVAWIERPVPPRTAHCLQTDKVGDQLEISTIVGEVAVPRKQRGKIAENQRIRGVQRGVQVQARPNRPSAATVQGKHQQRAWTNGRSDARNERRLSTRSAAFHDER